MKQTRIKNIRLLDAHLSIRDGVIDFANGKIISVGDEKLQSNASALSDHELTVIDGGGHLLTPGLVDIHTHGIENYCYEGSPQDFIQAANCLPRHGTTSVCPTLYNVMNRSSLAKLEALANAVDQVQDVHIPGLHLEGPFLAISGAGAATTEGDIVLLNELLAATKQRVAVMSISPETRNIIAVIELLVSQNIVPLITHTKASVEQTHAAIDAGAKHATHFYDVFHLPGKANEGVRPVGAVEEILADPQCTVDFIADGIHVHPAAIRMAIAAKGSSGVLLITDSNIGAGLPEGIYQTPWGFEVHVSPELGARNAQIGHENYGKLAGSALTMPQGIANLKRWLKLTPSEIWAMGTTNPATLLNTPSKGTLGLHTDADFVLWHDPAPASNAASTSNLECDLGGADAPRPLATWHAGKLVWADSESPLAAYLSI